MTEPSPSEKALISKLRFMGFLMFTFLALTFGYSLIPENPENKMLAEEDIAPEVAEIPPLNPYLIMASFAIVGTLCFIIAWRKNKTFNTESN